MSLKDWFKAGWLIEFKAGPREINDMLAIADRDIKDASVSGIGPDWKHNIAYSAALSCAAAVLAASGYRPARGEHHYRLVQSLSLTMGKKMGIVIASLEMARKKRNVGIYERTGVISDEEAERMLALAKRLRNEVTVWLKANHPELI